jgi:hypothetical protein
MTRIREFIACGNQFVFNLNVLIRVIRAIRGQKKHLWQTQLLQTSRTLQQKN